MQELLSPWQVFLLQQQGLVPPWRVFLFHMQELVSPWQVFLLQRTGLVLPWRVFLFHVQELVSPWRVFLLHRRGRRLVPPWRLFLHAVVALSLVVAFGSLITLISTRSQLAKLKCFGNVNKKKIILPSLKIHSICLWIDKFKGKDLFSKTSRPYCLQSVSWLDLHVGE